MADPDVLDRMRLDWNDRARQDAHYYVAFGRRGQDEEEFFASASDVVRSLVAELKRLAPAAGGWKALEIGCGPGRLMRPLSRHFGEIHGVDVSDEMIQRARTNLRDIPHAHAEVTGGADLLQFADDSFDFVYSYAVFQHIPSREVVFQYLREARRVLKPGGILRCQINGLPEQAARYNTWSGVRIPAHDVAAFARDHDFQLLALEGIWTQYLWTTLRKRPAGWRAGLRRRACQARVRNITNAQTGEPVAPSAGPFAAASLWIDRLPEDAGLLEMAVTFDGRLGRLAYLGPPAWDGVSQLNAALPAGLRTGLVPVELAWLGQPLASTHLRIIPPGPAVPRVCSVSDGINLCSGPRIESRVVKVILEEVTAPEQFHATVDGLPVRDTDCFQTDPVAQRLEVNFHLPEEAAAGLHELRMSLGKREFAPVRIEVA